METKETAQNIKPVPEHIAIIMDGNGRWAKAHGMDRSEGHFEGINTVHRIVEAAGQLGVKYLTLYAFSTENWNRPKKEVDALLNLFSFTLERETPGLIENNVRLEFIGDIDILSPEVRARLDRSMAATANGTGLTLVVAFSYSSRWEITRACKQIAEEAAAGKLNPEEVTDDVFRQHLATSRYPDPDLLIRTGGDFRVSNFLLWQIAYAEIIVTPTFWPDFTVDEFKATIDTFCGRERRFGLTSEQINQSL